MSIWSWPCRASPPTGSPTAPGGSACCSIAATACSRRRSSTTLPAARFSVTAADLNGDGIRRRRQHRQQLPRHPCLQRRCGKAVGTSAASATATRRRRSRPAISTATTTSISPSPIPASRRSRSSSMPATAHIRRTTFHAAGDNCNDIVMVDVEQGRRSRSSQLQPIQRQRRCVSRTKATVRSLAKSFIPRARSRSIFTDGRLQRRPVARPRRCRPRRQRGARAR